MVELNPESGSAPPLAQDDSSILDLAFCMDTTSSMGPFIHQAQQNIRTIVEEIVTNERSDVRLALVEYRDHPPQDSTFVTRTNDFTSSVKTMKGCVDNLHAKGGGDSPKVVADGLHQVLKVSWREEAAKICVFITDAPPHGLLKDGDSFPEGCPDGLDPVEITNQLAAKVIIGGAWEEISLQRLMGTVHQVVMDEMELQNGQVDEEAINARIHEELQSREMAETFFPDYFALKTCMMI